LPVLPRGHEQMGFPLSTSQTESVPQGEGMQGFVGGRTMGLQPTSGFPENPVRKKQADVDGAHGNLFFLMFIKKNTFTDVPGTVRCVS
jgi:hypothetical protein